MAFIPVIAEINSPVVDVVGPDKVLEWKPRSEIVQGLSDLGWSDDLGAFFKGYPKGRKGGYGWDKESARRQADALRKMRRATQRRRQRGPRKWTRHPRMTGRKVVFLGGQEGTYNVDYVGQGHGTPSTDIVVPGEQRSVAQIPIMPTADIGEGYGTASVSPPFNGWRGTQYVQSGLQRSNITMDGAEYEDFADIGDLGWSIRKPGPLRKVAHKVGRSVAAKRPARRALETVGKVGVYGVGKPLVEGVGKGLVKGVGGGLVKGVGGGLVKGVGKGFVKGVGGGLVKGVGKGFVHGVGGTAVMIAKTAANQSINTVKRSAKITAAVAKKAAAGVIWAGKKAGTLAKTIKDKAVNSGIAKGMNKLGGFLAGKAKNALAKAKKLPGAAKNAAMKGVNALRDQASKAFNAAKSAGAKAIQLGKDALTMGAKIGSALASGVKNLAGKMKDVAGKLGNKIKNVVQNITTLGRNTEKKIDTKVDTAVRTLKGSVAAVKNAIMGELASMKNELTQAMNKGFAELRTDIADMRNALSNQIAGLKQYVADVMADQGKKLAEIERLQGEYYEALKTGQNEIMATTQAQLAAKTDQLLTQMREDLAIHQNRFNALDKAMTQANLERNVIRTNILETKDEILEKTERDRLALELKLRGAEEKLTKKIIYNESAIKAGIAVSISGAIALALLI